MLGRTTATSDGAGQKCVFSGYPRDMQHCWEFGRCGGAHLSSRRPCLEGLQPVSVVDPVEVCAAWLCSLSEREQCCWVRGTDGAPSQPGAPGEACSHPAAAPEAGLRPAARGCCNRVACLWHLVGRATGFVVLLRNWDAAGGVGVAETSGSGWPRDGASPEAALWRCPSGWLAPLAGQPCAGGH